MGGAHPVLGESGVSLALGLVEEFPEEAGNPADWSALSPASIWEEVEGSIAPL